MGYLFWEYQFLCVLVQHCWPTMTHNVSNYSFQLLIVLYSQWYVVFWLFGRLRRMIILDSLIIHSRSHMLLGIRMMMISYLNQSNNRIYYNHQNYPKPNILTSNPNYSVIVIPNIIEILRVDSKYQNRSKILNIQSISMIIRDLIHLKD